MVDTDRSPTTQRQALDLFNQSLQQPAALRFSWLAEQCNERPELLSVVLKLLAADQIEDTVLDQPVLRTMLANPGDRTGPFELMEEIGAGGAGRVFRARRADGEFEQEVAVKLFEAQSLRGPLLERFHAERQILASLEHPGIARLIDGGTADNGLPYVAMELIRGNPITTYCADNELDIPSRLALFQKVCDALEVAHIRGIVHRDIKPGNVLVGEDGEPKIIDFGIAKVMDPLALGLPDSKTLTRFQALTPEYASPEQVRGEPVSLATDVYSLGVLLYEMLTGVRPYQISTLTPAEVERTVCHAIPDDPSDRVARRRSAPPLGLVASGELKRQLRGDIDRIVMTALIKEPEGRYRSAAALSRDIERYLSGHAIHARGASRLYRAGKFFQRNRTVSIAIGVVIMSLAGALFSVIQSARETRLEANRAEATASFLLEMISRADPFQSGGEKTLSDAVDEATASIDSQFADQPDIEAELRYTIGSALYSQAKYESARDQLQQALVYFEVHGPVQKEALVRTSLARIRWEDSAFEDAYREYQAALALVAQDQSAQGQTVRVEILVDLIGLMPYLERYDEGIRLGQQALLLVDQGASLSPLNLAVLYNNLATCFDAREDYPQSIDAYEKSIAHHRQVGEAHPDLAIALSNLAQTYELVGDMDSALSRAQEAYLMIRDILGDDHPEALLLRHNLGSLMINAEQYAGAAEHLTAAASAAESGYGPEHLYTGRFHFKAGLARYKINEFDAARQHVASASKIYAANDDTPQPWREALKELNDQLGL